MTPRSDTFGAPSTLLLLPLCAALTTFAVDGEEYDWLKGDDFEANRILGLVPSSDDLAHAAGTCAGWRVCVDGHAPAPRLRPSCCVHRQASALRTRTPSRGT